MTKALDFVLESIEKSSCSSLTRVVLGDQEPSFDKVDTPELISETLNQSQKDAIAFALGANEIALILGPPGRLTIFWFH